MEKVKSDVIFHRNLVPLIAAKGLLVLRYFCWHQWGHLWSRLPFTPREEGYNLAYLSAWKSKVQSHWLLREVDNHKCPWSQRELRVESKPRRFPGVPHLDLQEQLPVAIQSKEIKCWNLCRRIPNPIPQQMSTGLSGRLCFVSVTRVFSLNVSFWCMWHSWLFIGYSLTLWCHHGMICVCLIMEAKLLLSGGEFRNVANLHVTHRKECII